MNQPLPEPPEDSSVPLITARLSSSEVADAMWLAAHIGRVAVGEPRPPQSARERTLPDTDGETIEPSAPHLPPRDDENATATSTGSPRRTVVDLPVADRPPTRGMTGVRTRATSAFDATAIAKALRPLSRTSPSRRRMELDTETTAIGAAETGLWLPRFRPAGVQRFDAVLVMDEGGSMELWRDTVVEFHRLLQRQGAFRDVRVVRLNTDAPVPTRFAAQGEPRGSARHPLAELRDPTGRRIIFVLTDGVGQAWHDSSLPHWLGQWGSTESVVVVNVLRKPLWRRGNLMSHRTRLAASTPGTPNRRLRCSPLTADLPNGVLPVPVLDLKPRSMARWVRLVTAAGPVVVDLPTLLVEAPDGQSGDTELDREAEYEAEPTPAERVLRFRATASPDAFKLASLLAAAPLNVDVMRLVQHALLPFSHNSDLVEVYLSGLLRRSGEPEAGQDPHSVEFDFVDGVRSELLSAALRDDTVQVMRLVSDHHGHRVPTLRGLRDVLVSPETAGDPEISAATMPFLRVEHEVMRALGGPYVRRANQLRDAMTYRSDQTTGIWSEHPATVEPVGTAVVADGGNWPARGPAATWHDVPPRHRDFVGRAALLQALREQFDRESDPVLLEGMGGVGKSQVAVEYAYRNAADYDVVWWISAQDAAKAAASLAAMDDRLGGTDGTARRLLVFDNAGAPDQLRSLIPAGANDVLITSRDPLWTECTRPLKVDVFTRAESKQLLLIRCPSMSTVDAGRLAEALGDLPLAIHLAAAFLAETRIPVTDYLDELTKAHARLDEQTPDEQVPISGAWSVALERFQDECPSALLLLMVCSFLADDPIPKRIFRNTGEVEAPVELEGVLRDPVALGRAIRAINRHAMARIDYRHSTIQLHPFIRVALRKRMDDERTRLLRTVAHRLLLGTILTDSDASSTALLPHVRASGVIDNTEPQVRGMVVALIGHLMSGGHFAAAVELAEETTSHWSTALGADHPDALAVAAQLGVALRAVGAYRTAVDVHEKTYRLRTGALGGDHEESLGSGRLLGHSLRWAGDYSAARAICEETYRRAADVLGDSDPLALACAGDLAAVLRLTGEHRDLLAAKALQEETLIRKRYLLGDEDPGTLATVTDLALTLRLLGTGTEARRLNEIAHPRLRDVLGEDHPLTLACATNLAGDLHDAGEHEQAIGLDTATAALSARRLGDDHPSTLAARFNLSLDLRSAGRTSEADDLLADTFPRYQRAFGDQHPATRAADNGTRAWFEVADATRT